MPSCPSPIGTLSCPNSTTSSQVDIDPGADMPARYRERTYQIVTVGTTISTPFPLQNSGILFPGTMCSCIYSALQFMPRTLWALVPTNSIPEYITWSPMLQILMSAK